MQHNMWIYILVMALTTYLIRVLPLTLIRREIKNKFLRSFLQYVPYVTLSVMTVPDIIDTPASSAAGVAALIVGVVLAWRQKGLFTVAVACCAVVFVIELFV